MGTSEPSAEPVVTQSPSTSPTSISGTGTESIVVSMNELKNGIEGSPEEGGANGANISMVVVGAVASICAIALFVSKYKSKGSRNRNGDENLTLTADPVILSHSLPGPNVKRFAVANVVGDEDESASRSVSTAGAGMEDQEQPAQYSNHHHHHKYCPMSKRMAAAGSLAEEGSHHVR